MPKLKLSEWANVAEIIAAMVIVISLIYVGLEVNQNTQALRNEVHQNVMAILSEQQNVLVTDAEFHRIFATAEISPAELTDLEWSRFEEFLYVRFGVWEYLFVSYQDEAIPDSVWSAYEPYYLSIICKPGYQRWWQIHSESNNPDFVVYVNNVVNTRCK